MERRPVHLEHINFITKPGNTKEFHRQPRLFLSLKDAFDYIIRHDSKLIEEMVNKEHEVQPAIG